MDERYSKLLNELSDSELLRLQAAVERDALREQMELITAQRDELRETNEVLAGKLDDMIIVNGQALACSSYVRAEIDALREQLKDREGDLAHEYKRANDAEVERDALRTILVEWVDRYQYNAPADMVGRAHDAMVG